MKTRNINVVLVITLLATSIAYAQKAKLAPLRVGKSNVIDEIKALKSANPNIKPAELAERANQLLEKSGLNFELYFDAATCTKINSVKAQSKNPNAPVQLSGTLRSVEGDAAALALPEARFSDCGRCYMLMPLLQITSADFVTVVLGQNIRFHLPSNFESTEIVLVDSKDNSNIRRKWRTPSKMEPIGVSYDENVLYLAFNEPELSDLSLQVFEEGTFQIGTRAEAEEGGKGTRMPRSNDTTVLDYIKFDRWGKTYTVGSASSCKP